ncbi:MAG TPA: hypothetical protein PLJ43_08875 [Chitinophagales bacterium]|nr:hypothetical protein [Chitinophagales bacterium]HNA58222.1 hypothetical protein [Chitinophagales bacterium]
MRTILLILLTFSFFACNKRDARSVGSPILDKQDSWEILYWYADSIVRNNEMVKVYNSRLDTCATETGIFTYLQVDYPLTTAHPLIRDAKAAILAEQLGDHHAAAIAFKKVVNYYVNEREKDLELYSDINGILQYEVNAAIICSYAYEKLGDTLNAIEVLRRHLANVEARNCKIVDRYVELCIANFGQVAALEELNKCSETIAFKSQASLYDDKWVIYYFGGEIGLDGDVANHDFSAIQVNTMLQNMSAFKLLFQ